MKNQENKEKENMAPDDQVKDDASVILNNDAVFENGEIDPGFTPVADQDQLEQGTERNQGLGELDGTNPGSNHHPMDNEV